VMCLPKPLGTVCHCSKRLRLMVLLIATVSKMLAHGIGCLATNLVASNKRMLPHRPMHILLWHTAGPGLLHLALALGPKRPLLPMKIFLGYPQMRGSGYRGECRPLTPTCQVG
jgi:hypothetical protein